MGSATQVMYAATSRSSFRSVRILMNLGKGSLCGGSYVFSCQIGKPLPSLYPLESREGTNSYELAKVTVRSTYSERLMRRARANLEFFNHNAKKSLAHSLRSMITLDCARNYGDREFLTAKSAKRTIKGRP